MKYLTLFALFFLTACALKPNYYDVDPYIKITHTGADKVLVDGKEVKDFHKGDTKANVGTSFFDREITVMANGEVVQSYTLKTEYVEARGVSADSKPGKFILHNQQVGASPVFLLLPMNTLFGIVPTVGSLAFGILAQPFILINDIGLWSEPDYSLHKKVFEPFTQCIKVYNGLIVQDVVNLVNFPGVVYHNKWRQNEKAHRANLGDEKYLDSNS